MLSKTAKDKGWDVDFAVPLVVEVGIGNRWDKAHCFLILNKNPQILWVFYSLITFLLTAINICHVKIENII